MKSALDFPIQPIGVRVPESQGEENRHGWDWLVKPGPSIGCLCERGLRL